MKAFVAFFILLLVSIYFSRNKIKEIKESFFSDSIYDKAFKIDYDIPMQQYLKEVNMDSIAAILEKHKNKTCSVIYPIFQETQTPTELLEHPDDELNRFKYISDDKLSYPNSFSFSAWPENDNHIYDISDDQQHYLTIVDKYISDLFNNQYIMIDSNIQNIKKTDTGYVLKSSHVIYRKYKLYGFGIEVVTKHHNDEIDLIDYEILGTILSDKINLLNQENEDNQPYLKDEMIIPPNNVEFEKKFLCKKYHDIERLTGIHVNNSLIKCEDDD